jgi:CRISPR system Cascade subunit CasD
MSTLLLRLAGPMQSWGTQSRFTERDTGPEPSKSGVIGLLCAALGRPREAAVADLAALKMGVRVDRPGIMGMDYQTAGGWHRRGERYGVAQVDGGLRTIESRRYYLADADFLVGLEGDENLLRELDRALQHPVWPLYLGRRAFVPGEPIRLPDEPPEKAGLRAEPLREALERYPWPERRFEHERASFDRVQLVLESTSEASAELRHDVPISFQSHNRVFDVRYVKTEWISRSEVPT